MSEREGAQNAASDPDLVFVGAIAGAFGVRGEVRVKSFTAAPEAIFSFGPLRDAGGRVIFTVTSWRPIKDGFAAHCKEIKDRTGAEAAKSTQLFAPRAALPALEEGEFYHADLIGMAVQSLAGDALGRVRSVQDFGAGDLLEIEGTPGLNATWFLPFTRAAVPHIDAAARLITADPPPEALDPEDPDPEALDPESLDPETHQEGGAESDTGGEPDPSAS